MSYYVDEVDEMGKVGMKVIVKCDECGKVVDILDELVEDVGCGYVCCSDCEVGSNSLNRKRGRLVDEDGFEFEEM